MKFLFGTCLALLLAGAYLVWTHGPRPDDSGRTRLVWVTDDRAVRREQVGLFNTSHPTRRLILDPGNLVQEKIIVQSLAGIGPDLFDVAGLYTLDGFVQSGIALDLTDLAARYGFGPEKTWPSLADYIQIDGRQYAFPTNVYANVIFYNKDLFDRYKIPYPPRDPTWDQFVELGRRLTRRSADGRSYDSFGAMNMHWYELVLQAGGRMFRPDGLRCTLDSPEAVEAIRFYDDLMHKFHVMPTTEEETTLSGHGGWSETYLQWFAAGRLGMVRINRWGLVTFRQSEKLRGRLGVCHQPHLRKKICLVGAKMVAINRHGSRPEVAAEFIKFLTSPEFNRHVVRSADYLPPVPEYTRGSEFLHDPDHPEEDFNDVFIEAMDRGVAPERSPFVGPLPTLQAVSDQMDLLAAGLKSPTQACRDMTDNVNRLIYQNLCRYDKYRLRYQKLTGREFNPDDPEWKQ